MTTTRHARCTLAINGLHETLHVLPETLNGLHETLNGLHETFLTRNGLLAFHTVLKRFDFRSNRVLSDNPLMVRVVLKWHSIIKILIFDKQFFFYKSAILSFNEKNFIHRYEKCYQTQKLPNLKEGYAIKRVFFYIVSSAY